MHAGPGKVMALSPGAQNLQFDKSVIASNTSLQHKVNLYRLINVDTSREDANSDGGQVNVIGFQWSNATYIFLGLIILTVFVCFIRRTCCLLYTSPSPRDAHESRMPSSA